MEIYFYWQNGLLAVGCWTAADGARFHICESLDEALEFLGRIARP